MTLIVDNSILSALATCDTKTALRYAIGVTGVEESDGQRPLLAGTAAHAALASYFQSGGNVDAGMDALRAHYALDALADVPEGDRLSAGNVLPILDQWLRRAPGLPFRVQPADVELTFRVPLDPDHVYVPSDPVENVDECCAICGRTAEEHIEFTGTLDALAQDSTNAWYVVEHKTTGRMDERWRRRYKTSSQITGYVYAARLLTGRPVVGCFLNGIELSKLPSDAKRRCATHGVRYAECGLQHARSELLMELRSPLQLEQWRENAVRLARRYAALRDDVTNSATGAPDLRYLHAVGMQGQFNGSCGDCEFMDFCRVGRPLAQARSMLREQVWVPGGPREAQRLPAAVEAAAPAEIQRIMEGL